MPEYTTWMFVEDCLAAIGIGSIYLVVVTALGMWAVRRSERFRKRL